VILSSVRSDGKVFTATGRQTKFRLHIIVVQQRDDEVRNLLKNLRLFTFSLFKSLVCYKESGLRYVFASTWRLLYVLPTIIYDFSARGSLSVTFSNFFDFVYKYVICC
jgi:hypothetical protein